jgi:hypothetical protein
LAELQLLVVAVVETNMTAQAAQQVPTEYRGVVVAVAQVVDQAHIKADEEEMLAKFQHQELKDMEILAGQAANQSLAKQAAVAAVPDQQGNRR